jgi:hypothetical protein
MGQPTNKKNSITVLYPLYIDTRNYIYIYTSPHSIFVTRIQRMCVPFWLAWVPGLALAFLGGFTGLHQLEPWRGCRAWPWPSWAGSPDFTSLRPGHNQHAKHDVKGSKTEDWAPQGSKYIYSNRRILGPPNPQA